MNGRPKMTQHNAKRICVDLKMAQMHFNISTLITTIVRLGNVGMMMAPRSVLITVIIIVGSTAKKIVNGAEITTTAMPKQMLGVVLNRFAHQVV